MKIERADRMKGVEMSRIRATLTKCNEMKRAGIDLAMFTVGQPDFDTPQYIKDACEASIEAGHTAYAETPGSLELRTAIAKKLKRDNNLDYDRIYSELPTLNDVFLEITGKELRDKE